VIALRLKEIKVLIVSCGMSTNMKEVKMRGCAEMAFLISVKMWNVLRWPGLEIWEEDD